MVKGFLVALVFTAFCFAQDNGPSLGNSDTWQPAAVVRVDSSNFHSDVDTLVYANQRIFAKAIYLAPGSTAGTLLVNHRYDPSGQWFPLHLDPGYYSAGIIGLIKKTGSTVNLDSVFIVRRF